jgi:hypothetical protein
MASTKLERKVAKKPRHAVGLHRTPSSLNKELRTLASIVTMDKLKSSFINHLSQAEYLRSCRMVASCMDQLESKEVLPTYKGKDAPVPLALKHPGFTYADTKESTVMRDTFRSLFGDKHYSFRLSTALNMSSSAAGHVNSTISNSVLTSQADFVSLSTVFNEYFVVGFEVKWMPNSRYQYPNGRTVATALEVASLPIGKASLQHGQAAYSSLTAMADNFAFGYHSTGDPFVERWINTEKPSTETVVTSLTAPTQSWCPVNNASNYQGTLQFLAQAVPPALPVSTVLGTFVAHWHVLFRVRA